MQEMLINVSKHEDDFLKERYETHPRWVVELNNGETIYQDDGRPNVEPQSSWLRLKNYCDNNGLYIVHMRFQFRSHVENLSSYEPGYYFTFGVGGDIYSDVVHNTYNVGYVRNGSIFIESWLVPELIKQLDKVAPLNTNTSKIVIHNPHFLND